MPWPALEWYSAMLLIAFLGGAVQPSRTCRRAWQLQQSAQYSISRFLGDLHPSAEGVAATAYTIAELTYQSQVPHCASLAADDAGSDAVEFNCKFG